MPLVIPTGPEWYVGKECVTLVMPPPHPALHAHNTGHWRKKANVVTQLRWLAKQRALSAARAMHANGRVYTWSYATISFGFFFADEIQRDRTNCVQSQKPAVDGIVDSKLIAGDDYKRLEIGQILCAVDRDNPRTVICVRKLDGIVNSATRIARELGFPEGKAE